MKNLILTTVLVLLSTQALASTASVDDQYHMPSQEIIDGIKNSIISKKNIWAHLDYIKTQGYLMVEGTDYGRHYDDFYADDYNNILAKESESHSYDPIDLSLIGNRYCRGNTVEAQKTLEQNIKDMRRTGKVALNEIIENLDCFELSFTQRISSIFKFDNRFELILPEQLKIQNGFFARWSVYGVSKEMLYLREEFKDGKIELKSSLRELTQQSIEKTSVSESIYDETTSDSNLILVEDFIKMIENSSSVGSKLRRKTELEHEVLLTKRYYQSLNLAYVAVQSYYESSYIPLDTQVKEVLDLAFSQSEAAFSSGFHDQSKKLKNLYLLEFDKEFIKNNYSTLGFESDIDLIVQISKNLARHSKYVKEKISNLSTKEQKSLALALAQIFALANTYTSKD